MSKLKNIDIEDYWSIINYNYDQIQFAEVKATAVISIYSLIFGLGYTLDILDEENIYASCPKRLNTVNRFSKKKFMVNFIG